MWSTEDKQGKPSHNSVPFTCTARRRKCAKHPTLAGRQCLRGEIFYVETALIPQAIYGAFRSTIGK